MDFRARRTRKFLELPAIGFKIRPRKFEVNEYRALTAGRTF